MRFLISFVTYSQSSPQHVDPAVKLPHPPSLLEECAKSAGQAAYRPSLLAGSLVNIISFHSCMSQEFFCTAQP